MLNQVRLAAGAAAILVLSGCTAKGAWMGAAAEKAYDKELDAQRLVAIVNNDDYYEYHLDSRIYVLADKADVLGFLGSGEIPLRLTRIGGGPNGETVVFGIAKAESKKKDGFGAVEIYDGRRKGYEKEFYAEVLKGDRYHVFGAWAEFEAFRRSGSLTAAATATAADGKTVVFANSAPAVLARFKDIHG